MFNFELPEIGTVIFSFLIISFLYISIGRLKSKAISSHIFSLYFLFLNMLFGTIVVHRTSGTLFVQFFDLNEIFISLFVIISNYKNIISKLMTPILLCTLYFLSIILLSVYSTDSLIRINYVVIPLVLGSLTILHRYITLTEFVVMIKSMCLSIIALSFAALLFHPSWVVSPYSDGYLNFRYNGLVGHANLLAPIAIVYMILDIHTPFKNKYFRYALILLSLVSLIMCQSKTSLVAFVISCISIFLFRYYFRSKGYSRASLSAFYVLGLSLTVFTILNNQDVLLDSVIGDNSGISTLTGRTVLWDYASDVSKNNYYFGYGTSFLDANYDGNLGYFDWAPHAHNQFVDSLARFGFWNLLGLISIYLSLFFVSIINSFKDNGIGISLFILLAIRSISEVPFFLLYPNDIMIVTIGTVMYISLLGKKDIGLRSGQSE